MDIATQNTAFAQGFQRHLVKKAINFRIPEQIHYDPRRAAEFETLGRTLFNKSYKNPNPFSGILNTSLAGYGQLRELHGSRAEFLDKVRALRSLLSGAAEGTPEHTGYNSELQNLISGHHSDFKKRLTELGAVSEPRRRFLRTTLPATAAGVGGLGLGALGGQAVGSVQKSDDMANASLADRINYLINPGMIPGGWNHPVVPPSAQSPSAGDSGGV